MSSDCSELLSKALQWHVLPDSERAELLPIEQTIKRTWPFKILVIGGTEHTNEVKMEYYCFRSKNWEEMGDVQLSDEKIERNFVFLNENIYMMSGCERELGPMVASQSVSLFPKFLRKQSGNNFKNSGICFSNFRFAASVNEI